MLENVKKLFKTKSKEVENPYPEFKVETDNMVLSIEEAGRTVDSIKRQEMITKIISTIFVYIFIVALALVFVFPFYWMVITSFKQRTEIIATEQTFFPTIVMWSNYVYVFQVFDFGTFMFNTIVVAIFSTIGT